MWNKILEKIIKNLDLNLELEKIVQFKQNEIIFDNRQSIHLNKPIVVVAIGKSARWQWQSFRQKLIENSCLNLIQKLFIFDHLNDQFNDPFVQTQYLFGNHPITGTDSILATQELIHSLNGISADAQIIFLISGGTSAILELPAKSISKEQLIKEQEALFKLGLPIKELNQKRSQLSQVKCGGLLRLIPQKTTVSLVINDTFDEDDQIVGSGPTVDKKNFAISWDNASKLIHRLNKEIPDFKFQKQLHPNMSPIELYQQARALNHPFVGLVGEVSFDISSTSNKGGRNTHLCGLYLLKSLSKEIELKGFCSLATDGEDGSSSSAGAFFFGNLGAVDIRDLKNKLDRFDTLSALMKHDLLLKKFESPTNLMDIRLFSF